MKLLTFWILERFRKEWRDYNRVQQYDGAHGMGWIYLLPRTLLHVVDVSLLGVAEPHVVVFRGSHGVGSEEGG